jgi:uncharacterized spore protein YtfJ
MTNVALSLAQSLQSVGVSSVYGEPVEIDGSTLIPVAIRWYGFGGGSDAPAEGASAENSAGGGGGGGAVIPVGAYVKDDYGLRFQPNVVSVLAVAIPVIWTSGHALARVIKALKK